MTDLSRENLKRLARERTVRGDLFTYAYPVIPIQTKGRAYGRVSQEALKRGATIPDMALGTTKIDGRYIYAVLWDDASNYTPELMFDLAAQCMGLASRVLHLETLALPIFAGRSDLQWAMERGIVEMQDFFDDAGLYASEHVYVTQ